MFVNTDKFDNMLYNESRGVNPGIPALEDKGVEKLPVWPEAVKDLWAGMFKQTPEFNQEANGCLAKAMKDVMETQEWKNLRNFTRLDELGSAIGTVTFGNNFYDNLPPEVFELQKKQDEQKVLQDVLDEAKKPENQGENAPMSPEQIQKIQQQLGQVQGQIQKIEKKLTDPTGTGKSTTDIGQIIRIASRKAAEQSAKETSEMKDYIRTWGDTAGEGGKVPTLKEQMALASKIKKNKKFQKIVKMVGRMKRIAEGIQAKKITRVPEEIVDVETGRDLTSVLPSQFSLLCNKSTKLEFYRQYEERSLLQYKKVGTEKAGKGPILVMVDESGSMDGDRILWAKAIGLALAHLAKKQKRTIWLGGFSSRGQVWVKKFEKGVISGKDLDTYIEQFYCGGTDYDAALMRCIKVLKEEKKEKADVIFLSDGDCEMSTRVKDEFNKLKKEMAFRVFGIGVGVGTESFEDFCDQSYEVSGSIDGTDEICLEGIFGV